MGKESGFEDGSRIIELNPSPEFDRILNLGYTVEYRVVDEMGDSKELFVRVMHDGTEVGNANFINDESDALSQNVFVEAAHRRRGIATAIYVFAEKVFVRPLSPIWAGEQTPEAKALWAKPGRPFGNRARS